MIAVLVNVRSSHNVGSIFRTADAAGFTKLVLCGITPAPTDRFGKVNSEIAKVSLGAEKFVAWEKSKSAVIAIKKLRKQGYIILALEQSKNSIPYTSTSLRLSPLEGRAAIIVGDEVKGIPHKILKLADKILEIPMHGHKESLNVAVAFGIAAFRLIE